MTGLFRLTQPSFCGREALSLKFTKYFKISLCISSCEKRIFCRVRFKTDEEYGIICEIDLIKNPNH